MNTKMITNFEKQSLQRFNLNLFFMIQFHLLYKIELIIFYKSISFLILASFWMFRMF